MAGKHLIKEGLQLVRGNPVAQKWLVIGALNQIPPGMIMPFIQVFAKEIKGASGYILGGDGHWSRCWSAYRKH